MKKFLSFLLTFVMLFSLTMPAMAAEVTGGTEGEVSGAFAPDVEFTGITYIGEAYSYDESTNTYTVAVLPDQEKVAVEFRFDGKNLEYLTLDYYENYDQYGDRELGYYPEVEEYYVGMMWSPITYYLIEEQLFDR